MIRPTISGHPLPVSVALHFQRAVQRRPFSYVALLGMIPSMKLAKDLVAASAAPLVLAILEGGESYGYAIIGRVRELSDGRVRWTDGMLYPVLHRLEAQGAITARWRTAENGRRRKYYALSAPGRRALAEHKRQWDLVNGMLANVWSRVSGSAAWR
jgi:PadR family transcriptional regulator, regulatory protein PadR